MSNKTSKKKIASQSKTSPKKEDVLTKESFLKTLKKVIRRTKASRGLKKTKTSV